MDYYVLLSGGIDSACLLAHYQSMTDEIAAIHVSYGQLPFNEERAAASAVADHFGVPIGHIDTGQLSPISFGEIPGRNAMLLAVGQMVAAGHGVIGIGIHAGTSYADCSPAFIAGVQSLFDLTSGGALRADAPFAAMSKSEMYRLAKQYEVPIHLTWSCEREGPRPCLRCLSCKDRSTLVEI